MDPLGFTEDGVDNALVAGVGSAAAAVALAVDKQQGRMIGLTLALGTSGTRVAGHYWWLLGSKVKVQFDSRQLFPGLPVNNLSKITAYYDPWDIAFARNSRFSKWECGKEKFARGLFTVGQGNEVSLDEVKSKSWVVRLAIEGSQATTGAYVMMQALPISLERVAQMVDPTSGQLPVLKLGSRMFDWNPPEPGMDYPGPDVWFFDMRSPEAKARQAVPKSMDIKNYIWRAACAMAPLPEVTVAELTRLIDDVTTTPELRQAAQLTWPLPTPEPQPQPAPHDAQPQRGVPPAPVPPGGPVTGAAGRFLGFYFS